MNGTPRLRSAFPATPENSKKNDQQYASATGSWITASPPAALESAGQGQNAPLIPSSVLDAPSQRLYVVLFYTGLTLWRFYDYFALIADDTESLWLFMKWAAIDGVVLYGLPGLRIPWLQWSSWTVTLVVLCHIILDAILMFRIPIPLQAWLLALFRALNDRELAVSERSVNPGSVLHNASLILGKQIIHILPEGLATLNPEQQPFCIDGSKPSVILPLKINQTSPILVELLRIDLDNGPNQTISIRGKELSRYMKQAERELGKHEDSSPRYLRIPVKDTGLYRLQRVVDKSELEVQKRSSDTFVVQCPSASVNDGISNKCKDSLSDFKMEVKGVPPLRIRYTKTVNNEYAGCATLTIYSTDAVSPPDSHDTSDLPVARQANPAVDIGWARSLSIPVPINESLSSGGDWQYSINEVQDACGNIVTYSDPSGGRLHSLGNTHLEHVIKVFERPRAQLHSCDPRHELKAAKGESVELPIRITWGGPRVLDDSTPSILYQFTPMHDLQLNQEHGKTAQMKNLTIEKADPSIQVAEPGLYSLNAVGTTFCSGEILEPSTCLLSNPPEPSLSISHSDIPDRCARKSVGLSVNMDLSGTPPFRVGYSIQRMGDKATRHSERFDRRHGQLELRPPLAGHYIYQFDTISDSVYKKPRAIQRNDLMLEQDIIPPASARFADAPTYRKVCIGEPVSFDIEIIGDNGPFVLEYELLHNGGRRKPQRMKATGIEDRLYNFTTDELKDGGQYTLALTSIADNTGCKTPLSEETKLDVGLQKPKIAFGTIDQKRSLMALEGKEVKLPLRLQGTPPWSLSYINFENADNVMSASVYDPNDKLAVSLPGHYEIMAVHDAACPGLVDNAAKDFKVGWIPRPTINFTQGAAVKKENKYVRGDLCEGDEDSVDIVFTGTPPFSVSYEQRHKEGDIVRSMFSKSINAGLDAATIRLEASVAGTYEYSFVKLGDYSYNHDPRTFSALHLEQQVHPRPSARFTNTGKTYRYCKEESAGKEKIPITLFGKSPFDLDIEIKHHAAAKPETRRLTKLDSNQFEYEIPHEVLALGTHAVTIRNVKDARGCERRMDFDAPHVQVSVADVPTISPLEERVDYCVGDRIAYTLSGSPPFKVYYNFQGHNRKATVPTTNFRRLAESPGNFIITDISDQRSTDACRAKVELTKIIHELPSVRVSKGKTATTDIHEGDEAKILFEFGGTPPFEFTYTRSTNVPKGKKSQVLETKSAVSEGYSKTVIASDEGIYEVVSIKDRYCSFSTQRVAGNSGGQKLLTYR
ncbi:MAG: hypothetical protein Q9191_000281 [Dirinaria sp. TL-2023a]